jgi:uncharacterized protein (DUF1501 family)
MSNKPISRRRFIGAAGATAGVVAVGGGIWTTTLRDSVEQSVFEGIGSATSTTTTLVGTGAVPYGDRILVVLEMAGGNDAINTLVPASGLYNDARRDLVLPADELVALSGTDYRLHPALAPLARYWDDGSMAAIAGVGLVDQSRSHFKAMDTWWSGSPGVPAQTGWLGRWLDATLEGANDPLRAIALGGGSPALVGDKTLATVVRNPANFSLRTFPNMDADALISAFLATAEPLASTPELAAAQEAIPSTLEAVALLASVSGDDDETAVFGSGPQRGGESATDLLQTAAGIINLGIGTRVITVGISGFDTHADQLSRHQDLLTDVGAGLAAFFERLAADGNLDKVMVVTTSEFGRRIQENGSFGTDHGTGGLQFIFGPRVVGALVVGELDLANPVNGDLPVVLDTRSVYSVALDWLGGPTDEILGGPHDRLGLLAA